MRTFSGRMRDEEFARLEAAGSSPWTVEADGTVRRRVMATFEILFHHVWTHELAERAAMRLRVTDGWATGMSREAHLEETALSCGNYQFWSIVEVLVALAPPTLKPDLEGALNGILGQERVRLRMVDGKLIPRTSEELHAEVVEPALRLLASRSDLSSVESAYQKALREIAVDPGDAITDASTALQELLESLECRGNALGPLLKDAKRRKLLADHDGKLIEWVAADRSALGDAHHDSVAQADDAWLIVHVVGALILRLVGPTRAARD
jgi:hypothetical protein